MENEVFFVSESSKTECEFSLVLEKENQVLDAVSCAQKKIREALKEKNWENLVLNIEEMNTLSESFIQIDSLRDTLQKELSFTDIKKYSETLRVLRGKLLKSKIENDALNDYTSITRGFLQGVLDKVPQGRTKTYSREGRIVQTQPTSVVLNINY